MLDSLSIQDSSLRVVITPEAIQDMLCCSRINNTKVFDKDAMEDYWHSRRDIVPFCQANLNRSSLVYPPKLPIHYSDLRSDDLKDISSTIALLCSHDNDREINAPMMGFLLKY